MPADDESTPTQQQSITPVTTSWEKLVLICKDCDDGSDLADDLKKRWKKRHFRAVRVVRSSCLDVCPKRGVTCVAVTEEGTHRAVVRRGTSIEELETTLLGWLGASLPAHVADSEDESDATGAINDPGADAINEVADGEQDSSAGAKTGD